ncbi:hypothetical protein FEM48_Zijuj01G0040300 [Ziziphus jujuba var. spinosa]|uniref:Cathepsin propeptide inhibitor domain-containing protein n=1 Tax=Ziziphus jujuba var. spinosa TaxID=714518 RepID=A0A978VZ15_ZIZJJ|nr:hypothetical protein FEM48_Zijuj01G0040300 [Ziziphus jujuba var. spinosa]
MLMKANIIYIAKIDCFLFSQKGSLASQAMSRTLHDEASTMDMHEKWINKHEHTYADTAEEEKRLQIFKENVGLVENFHNAFSYVLVYVFCFILVCSIFLKECIHIEVSGLWPLGRLSSFVALLALGMWVSQVYRCTLNEVSMSKKREEWMARYGRVCKEQRREEKAYIQGSCAVQ